MKHSNIYKAIHTNFDCETMQMNSKAFSRAFRNEIRKSLKEYGYTLVKKEGQPWCESTGFITDNKNHFIYFSSGDFRWEDWENKILIRGCKDAKDFKGFSNYFTSLDEIGNWCYRYFSRLNKEEETKCKNN